jgi:hypothetical protein
MAFTNPEDQIRYSHEQYLKYKDKVNVRARKRLKEVRLDNHEKMGVYLNAHPCVVCGEKDIVVLEFNHKNPSEKYRNIAQLTSSCRWEKILPEIEKCEVVCANCHKRITAKQRGWWKAKGAACAQSQ